jgi:hypothetical protein
MALAAVPFGIPIALSVGMLGGGTPASTTAAGLRVLIDMATTRTSGLRESPSGDPQSAPMPARMDRARIP